MTRRHVAIRRQTVEGIRPNPRGLQASWADVDDMHKQLGKRRQHTVSRIRTTRRGPSKLPPWSFLGVLAGASRIGKLAVGRGFASNKRGGEGPALNPEVGCKLDTQHSV